MENACIFYYLWIAKSGLILYHFGSQKKWFVFISFASLLLVGFIREFYMISVDIGGEGGVGAVGRPTFPVSDTPHAGTARHTHAVSSARM